MEKPANDMRTAYLNGLKKGGNTTEPGPHKGYTNEKVADLMRVSESGPLDHAGNQSRKSEGQFHMQKISEKMQST